MRADLFEIRLDGILYVADQPVVREGLKVTLSAYEDSAANLLANDRINLDRQSAREKFATTMAGPKPDHETLAKGWELKRTIYRKALWQVRETLMEALAPGAPQAEQPAPAPDAPMLKEGLALLDAPDVLAQAGETIRQLGYAGQDTSQPRLLILALVSRSLERPINIVVTGPSSAGKSHLVGLVTRIFPEEATYVLAGMSERVLAYSQADLRHRYLIIGEASALHHDGMGASLLRNLAWEGQIRYEVTEKDAAGQQVTRVVEREGPTGFVTTTTGKVEGELATRVLPLYIDDTPAGTRVILRDAARRAAGAVPDSPDVEPWWAALWWLRAKGEHRVVIPFAPALEERYPDKLVRTRRDFPQLLNLIRASAILHQRQRDRDGDGRIIATLDDYRVVFEVAAPVYAALTAEGLTPAIRETVAAVAELVGDGKDSVSIAGLSDRLALDKDATYRRAIRAISGGWLVNVQEKHRGPLQLVPGAAMPTHSTGLPNPDDLKGEWTPPDPPPRECPPDDPPAEAAEKTLLDLGVRLSDLPDSADTDAENGRTTVKIRHDPTIRPTAATVGSSDSVGNRSMSDCFADSGGQNKNSRTIGHGDTGTFFSQPPKPRNDEIVGHIEWNRESMKSCTHCHGRTWWRVAESAEEYKCVTCHPPNFA